MTIPSNLRVPFVYVEFDPSRAFQGPAVLNYQVLLMGQLLAAGTKSELQIDQITSADQAAEYYGAGSQLALAAAKWFANNRTTDMFAVGIDDAAGTAATGTIAFSGTATAAGTIHAYIAGQKVSASIDVTDDATDVGDKLVAAADLIASLPTTQANSTGTVTFTAKNKGTVGDDIDLRLNYNAGEGLPAGITAVITGMGDVVAGATDPDVGEIITILGDEWYNLMVGPWTDATNLGKIETELADRFGPIRMIDGVYHCSHTGTQAELATFGNGRNSPHVNCMHSQKVPNTPLEMAAATAGQAAAEGAADPARPFQTLELKGILPPIVTDRFTFTENNTLLFDGISTFSVDSGGKVRIQRLITMYQKNVQGAPDIAYLNENTLLSLMYIRFDWRTGLLTKYPRAKLANDDTRIGSGQSVMTPKVGRAEAVAKFRQWENLGLVENIEQFKKDLIVERSATDPDRLDFLLPPDLINQFRVAGSTIQFLLESPTV